MYHSTSGRFQSLSLPQPQDPQAPWPVDLVHLRRYTMGDKQLEIEVLGLFAGELPNTVARLEGAQSERDWRLAAHTMKGSARAVGAWRVARAAQAAEQFRFDAAETDERRAAMGPITAAVSEALIYIRELSAAN